MAGVVANYTVTIGGATVNVQGGNLDITNQIGQRSVAHVTTWGPLGVTYQYGTQALVYDETSALVYRGYVQKDKATRAPGARQGDAGYLEHELDLMDPCYLADKRAFFYAALNTPAGTIVQAMLSQVLSQEGVTATATSIAAGTTISKYEKTGVTCKDALDWLAKTSGYWWNIDRNKVLWFQPYTGVPSPYTIDGTQVDSYYGQLSLTTGNEMYVNTQYVKGVYGETKGLVETFHGDGTTRSFTLSYEIARLTEVSLNGADISGSLLTKGSAGGAYYYDVGDAVLAQDPAQTVLTSGDTLVVTYNGRYPILAQAANSALIAAQQAREGGTSGIVEALTTNRNLTTQASAFQEASALLAHYGQDMRTLEFDTPLKGYEPGQSVVVSLPDFNLVNAPMLVQSVEIGDSLDGLTIWYHVSAVGSPYDVAQWQTYWTNLQNQTANASDLSDVDDAELALIRQGSATLHLRANSSSLPHVVCPLFPMTFPFTLC